MSVDPAVLAAMEAAVAAQPGEPGLRAHLCSLLLEAGRAADALATATAGLATHPQHPGLLRAVADAAEAVHGGGGDDPPAAVPAAVVPAADEFDAFLHDVLEEDRRTRVTLADVGGLDDVKRRLEASFLGPLRNPELRAMYGASLRGGLLLYGPPGCGKTFLARAVAGELGVRFLAIGLHDVLEMWFGNSERNLHAIFEEARRSAPCVLFLDELDALGQKRSALAGSAGRNVVAQLLQELDGIDDDNEGVYVLGATNAPWDVDPALRRPGRFDRMLLVLPPDEPARAAILGYHLRDKPVDGKVSIDKLAARTDRFSGADLKLLCQSAAEHALGEAVRTGQARPIGQRDLEAGAKSVAPSTGPWFEAARNVAQFANADGQYDELLAYLRARRLA